MRYDPQKHHRRSIRLKGYDYASPGAYFITICAQNRERMFGAVDKEGMQLNGAGRMVERWYRELPNKFPGIIADRYVVMPDHFHCIIILGAGNIGADPCVGPESAENIGPEPIGADRCVCPESADHSGNSQQGQTHNIGQTHHSGQTHRSAPDTDHYIPGESGNPGIPGIIQWFKTMTTNEYIRGVRNAGWRPFDRRLWQRNYYEHIVRQDGSIDRIRKYIDDNPARWHANANDLLSVEEVVRLAEEACGAALSSREDRHA